MWLVFTIIKNNILWQVPENKGLRTPNVFMGRTVNHHKKDSRDILMNNINVYPALNICRKPRDLDVNELTLVMRRYHSLREPLESVKNVYLYNPTFIKLKRKRERHKQQETSENTLMKQSRTVSSNSVTLPTFPQIVA